MELLKILETEWAVVSQAPFTFIFILALAIGIAVLLMRLRYQGTINGLKQRLLLRAEQAESYKERALEFEEKVEEVVDSSEIQLKERTLELVSNIRDFNAQYDRAERNMSERHWEAMQSAKPEEERSKIWNQNTAETMRLSQERNIEYDRKYKVDTILLRDELLSRLPEYKTDMSVFMFEHPTNPIGMGMVADELEKMAKSLIVANNAHAL